MKKLIALILCLTMALSLLTGCITINLGTEAATETPAPTEETVVVTTEVLDPGQQQLIAPTDDFVMDRLKTIETITDIAAVTEEHDPNGKLNKQGGYIGCIYFRDSRIDWSHNKGDVIDVGCIGGGAIEIFKTVEEAEARDTYLAAFDGSTNPGSHYVYGTCIVRVSKELTATQQQELTDQIVEALTRVED